MHTMKRLLLGAGLVALSAGAAAAAPATVESGLNLRSGPGTEYAVIDTMPAGARVDVGGCTGGWCQVSFNGEQGYASRAYLDLQTAAVEPGYDYYGSYGPSYGYYNYYEPGYAYSYPSIGFGWYGGRRHRHHHHHHGEHHQLGAGYPGQGGNRVGEHHHGGPGRPIARGRIGGAAGAGVRTGGRGSLGAGARMSGGTVGAGAPAAGGGLGARMGGGAPAGGGHAGGGHR